MKKINISKSISALYLFLIFLIVVLADLGKLPLYLLWKIPHYDWLAHLVLYGLLYRILENMLDGKRVSLFRWSVEKSFFVTLLLITIEEFSQLIFPSRTFSFMDLFMGVLGMLLFRKFLKYKTR